MWITCVGGEGWGGEKHQLSMMIPVDAAGQHGGVVGLVGAVVGVGVGVVALTVQAADVHRLTTTRWHRPRPRHCAWKPGSYIPCKKKGNKQLKQNHFSRNY